jgi:hypothetical protein
LIYDNTKNTFLEGFGVTQERAEELKEQYIHGSRGDCLDRICNSTDLPPNEQYLLLVTLGSLVMEHELYERAVAFKQYAEQSGK